MAKQRAKEMKEVVGNADAYMERRWRNNNAATCLGKKIYSSFDAAMRMQNQMQKTKLYRAGSRRKENNLRAYRCFNCGQFHIGHPKRKHHFKEPYRRVNRVSNNQNLD